MVVNCFGTQDNHCLCCHHSHISDSTVSSVQTVLFLLQRNLQTAGKVPAGKQRQSFIHRCAHVQPFRSLFWSTACNPTSCSVQGCHSKISTIAVERRSWWTLTSHWGLSWPSSETTNWYGRARWSLILECPTRSAGPCKLGAHHSFASLQGGDGVEYLIVAVDASTLTDFLENEERDWEDETSDLMIFSNSPVTSE